MIKRIEPHAGPQTQILQCPADIAIFGGAAGGGKSFALLVDAVRWVRNPNYGGVIFRRTFPRITNEGALWDESQDIYPHLGGKPNAGKLEWKFPSGARIAFRHLTYEKTVKEWHGAQVPFIGFDEITEFTERQFWYMQSRNRSTCGVRPYLRGTCNPDCDSWIANLISWWIGEDGYAIPERSGVIRWFIRPDGQQLHWFDSREEAVEGAIDHGIEPGLAKLMPKSFTFVPSKLTDNPTLLKNDPGYMATLLSMPLVDRERLLGGNWKIRAHEGLMFPRRCWNYCRAAPAGVWLARGWDKAGTEGGKGARTAGVLVGWHPVSRRWYVMHGDADRLGDIEREKMIKNYAVRDDELYHQVPIIVEQEGGSGGKESALNTIRALRGHTVHAKTVTGEKASRWRPFATQQQAGNVTIVADGTWDHEEFVQELDALAGSKELDKPLLKDYADAGSIAFNWLANATEADIPDELLASGDPEWREEEHQYVPDDELDELPPAWRSIIKELRAQPGYRGRGQVRGNRGRRRR